MFRPDLRLPTIACVALLAAVSQAQHPVYRIVEIEPLDPTDPTANTNATGMNELGHVVGVSDVANFSTHAFLYKDGQLVDLSLGNGDNGGNGKGVNDLGVAVGYWNQPLPGGGGATVSRPFIASETMPMSDPAVGVGSYGWCWGINNSGQLALSAGGAYFSDPVLGVQPIAFPDTPPGYGSEAWEINNDGLVVGEATRADLELHAFGYDIATGVITDLHDPSYRMSRAYGVNDNGDVCGFLVAFNYETYPVVWTASGQTIVMPNNDLSPDLFYGAAEHVNNHGDVVGMDYSVLPVQPVGWISYAVTSGQPIVKHRLRDLLSPQDRQAWTRMHPFEINDAGQICGTGIVDGRTRAFLMTPFVPQAAPPTVYCSTAPNTGSYQGAQIFFEGTQSVSAADFTLVVDYAVPGTMGYFFYGGAQTQTPFGDGFLCVGAGSAELYRVLPMTSADSTGTAVQLLDWGQFPVGTGAGSIHPGSTWNFQFWFRDPGASSTNGFNLSNALRVPFHG